MNAAAILLLAEKGLSAHDIAEVALAIEGEQPKVSTAAEKRRAWDRQRKREQREAERMSGGMSGGNPPDPSPNERDNLTPTRESKTEAKASSKSLIEREKLAAVGSCLRAAFPPPPEVVSTVWADFLRSPKRRKAGMSQTAYASICRNLVELAEHGFPPGEMIALAVERGWTTVRLDWVLNDKERRPGNGQSTSNVTSLRGSRPDPALDLYRAACAAEDREDNLRTGASLPAIAPGRP